MHFAARRVAGAGAASAALWYVAAAPQEDRRAQEEESCRKLGLMLPTEAQRTAVARIPGFLSARECDDVRDVVRGLKCATIERSAGAFSRPPGFPGSYAAARRRAARLHGPLDDDVSAHGRPVPPAARRAAEPAARRGRRRRRPGALGAAGRDGRRQLPHGRVRSSFSLLSRPPRRRPQVPPVPARRRPPGRAPLRRRFVDHHGPHARGAGRRLRGRRLRHARGRRVRSRRRLSFWFLDWRRRSVARHAFDKGDLVLFVSHKYHNVRDLLFYLPSPRRFRSSPSRGARAWCWWRSCGAARRRRAPTGARRSGRAGTRSRTCARGGRRWRRGCLGKDVVCESHGPRAVRETAYYRHNVSCLLTLLLAPRAPPHRHGLR